MNRFIKYLISASLVVASSLASAADIVARATATELRRTNGNVVPRIERDKDNRVVRLLLNDMELSPEEVVDLGKLKYLRSLVLFRTNITDEDLAHLGQCKDLEHLNLTGTEVTDAAIETILKFDRLKSLCLGNVNITPKALDKLKERNRRGGERLRWGYSQRKR